MTQEQLNTIWPGWVLVRKLGQGSYGGVYEIQSTLPGGRTERSAMKKISIPKSQDEIELLLVKSVPEQSITEHYRQQMQKLASKIFNGRGSVPDSTRDFVLSKAQELGYHQLSEAEATTSGVTANNGQNIALLTHSKPLNHNFGSLFITNFTDEICRSGYNLKVFEISQEDYIAKELPDHFLLSEVSGIIAIELFDRDYTQMLCGLGIPVMLIDSYVCAPSDLMQCDLVYMENYASTIAMTSRMIAAGAKHLGFVGDINHCSSFRERWNGFRAATDNAGLPLDRSVCILADDAEPYGEVDWLTVQLDAMPYLPDGFVCANDFLAIRIMQALRRKGVCVPNDVMVTGFDGSPEAEVVSPSLTTAQIPSAQIGRISADMLLERIASPQLPYRCTFLKTTPIWRESTR